VAVVVSVPGDDLQLRFQTHLPPSAEALNPVVLFYMHAVIEIRIKCGQGRVPFVRPPAGAPRWSVDAAFEGAFAE
jgi:hypothetical protein